MAFRDVRVKELGNRLVLRFDPDTDMIEFVERKRRVLIALDDYRPPQMRRRACAGVDFARIEGGGAEEAER